MYSIYKSVIVDIHSFRVVREKNASLFKKTKKKNCKPLHPVGFQVCSEEQQHYLEFLVAHQHQFGLLEWKWLYHKLKEPLECQTVLKFGLILSKPQRHRQTVQLLFSAGPKRT